MDGFYINESSLGGSVAVSRADFDDQAFEQKNAPASSFYHVVNNYC